MKQTATFKIDADVRDKLRVLKAIQGLNYSELLEDMIKVYKENKKIGN